MKRAVFIMAAAMAATTFSGMAAFGEDPNMPQQTTGDSIRNTADRTGAGTPTADNPAPDAKDIRKTISNLSEEALTKGDMTHLVNRFVDADRNRIKNSPTASDNYGAELDGRIEQINQAWKAKYGHDFDIKKNVNDILGSEFASIQQGVIGNNGDAQLASEVEKNSEDRNTTDQKNNQGNTKGDENLENGRSIAVVVVQGMHGQPDLRVPLIHELPDSWKINVPDSLDANKLRQNLQDHLTAIGQMSTEWPSDENQAYRTVAHHILMAVLDVPVPAK